MPASDRESMLRDVKALANAGRVRDACAALEAALPEHGRWAEGAVALAKLQAHLGRVEDAVATCRRAVTFQPDLAEAQGVLGSLLMGQGRMSQAQDAYTIAARLEPQNAVWNQGIGRTLALSHRLRAAADAFRHAIQVAPLWADARTDLGRTLEDMRDLPGARACYEAATQLNPQAAEAWHRLGVVEGKLGRLDRAVARIERAVELDPQRAVAHFDLGVAHEKSERDDLAGAAYERVIALRPADLSAIDALGRSLRRRGKLDEALRWFRRGVELDPANVACHSWLGLTLLLQGSWEEGWREYEWRWKSPTFPITKYSGPQPQWTGEDLAGKRIMVYTEQGFGDAIQFARYLPLVARRHGRVAVIAQPELVRLMQCVDGVEQVVPRGSLPAPFEVCVPMMTLPGLFESRVGHVPPGTGYIRLPVEVRDLWAERLAGRLAARTSGVARVGIVWAGRPEHENDKHRSLPLAFFAPLGRIPGMQLLSLQLGEAVKQAAGMPPAERPVEIMEGVGDFLDTAAVIEQLDLVIGVDTAVVHLAGALGKPVWTVLPPLPDWRWLMEGETTMWYPAMRLFRRRIDEPREAVLERVAGALPDWLRSRQMNSDR